MHTAIVNLQKPEWQCRIHMTKLNHRIYNMCHQVIDINNEEKRPQNRTLKDSRSDVQMRSYGYYLILNFSNKIS